MVVAADQPGNADWQAAPQVTQAITVAAAAGSTPAASSSSSGGTCGSGSGVVGLFSLALVLLRLRRLR